MDRSYLLHSSLHPSIEELAIDLFRHQIVLGAVLDTAILKDACLLLERDRNNASRPGNSILFGEAVNMFHALSVYSKAFEPVLLGESQTFFREWAATNTKTEKLAQYVKNCHALMLREKIRGVHFDLETSTMRGLNEQMYEYLVKDKLPYLLERDSVCELMGSSDFETLQELFKLIQAKGHGECLRPVFDEYINAQGSKIVFDHEREDEMVFRLLRFKKKLDKMWAYSFDNHEGLGHTLREAFETFINKSEKSDATWGTDNSKPGEMIAKYVDIVLKGGIKSRTTAGEPKKDTLGWSEDQDNFKSPEICMEGVDDVPLDEEARINQQLDQVLDLFRFVHGKAVFEAFYKKDFARRLLLDKSASADAEKSMLTRLTSGKSPS